MRTSFRIGSATIVAAALALVACGGQPGSTSDPTPTNAPSAPSTTSTTNAEHPDVVIPATGDALAHGISSWAVYDESGHGAGRLRALGLDAKGNQIEALRIEHTTGLVTIADLMGGGQFQVKTEDGTVVEQSLGDPDRTKNTITDLRTDIGTFQQLHPGKVAFDCGWLIAEALATCSLVYPVCVGTGGLACIAAGLACERAMSAANRCLSQPPKTGCSAVGPGHIANADCSCGGCGSCGSCGSCGGCGGCGGGGGCGGEYEELNAKPLHGGAHSRATPKR